MFSLTNLKRVIRGVLVYRKQHRQNAGRNVSTYCFGGSRWFERFIESRFQQLPKNNWAVIGIYEQPLTPIVFNRAQHKIFYTAENVHVPESHWQSYEHLFLEDKRIDLSLGFDYVDHVKYCRLPFWVIRHFKPTDTYNDIVERINGWNCQQDRQFRDKSCAMICRSDYFGDRAVFADMMESVIAMNYPGKFRHNDDDLFGEKFKDNKLSYLRQFKFNLCPENSNFKGYVTEKIFDAISSGCIPVYWGSDNDPESGIFNKNSIIFLSLDGDNTEALAKIKHLNEDKEAYSAFIMQPYFTSEAPKLIWDILQNLEEKIRKLM